MSSDVIPSLAATRVAAALRERITEGQHLPGTALRETWAASAFAVSRNTVREAFRLLAHDGLVEHVPNRGVTVRALSAADIRDIYRIRRVVEALGLAAAANDPAPLTATVVAAEQAAAAGDWSQVATFDLRFHQCVVMALGSQRLDQLCRRLLAELRLGFVAVRDVAGFHAPYLARNRLMVDLLVSGELDRAQAELAAYLDDAEQELVAALS